MMIWWDWSISMKWVSLKKKFDQSKNFCSQFQTKKESKVDNFRWTTLYIVVLAVLYIKKCKRRFAKWAGSSIKTKIFIWYNVWTTVDGSGCIIIIVLILFEILILTWTFTYPKTIAAYPLRIGKKNCDVMKLMAKIFANSGIIHV